MKGFIKKVFGGKAEPTQSGPLDLVADVIEALIEKADLDLSFDIEKSEDKNALEVEFYGEDEELLVSKEGQLLDAIQLFSKRVLQHQMKGENINVNLDCDGFREQANQSLIDLAEKLKGIAMDKGKPVYFRALPPRDRKVIHQYLASDERVKSRSVGDGLYKKIKIFPVKGGSGQATASDRPH